MNPSGMSLGSVRPRRPCHGVPGLRSMGRRIRDAGLRATMGTITNVMTSEPLAALTFDDGPHPVITPRLLNILHRADARATFFMVGDAARRHGSLLHRVAEAGHAIGNHSWNHPSFPELARRERIRQVRDCQRVLAPYGRRLFRPPYGHQDLASRLDIAWLRYNVVAWNIDAGDWESLDVGEVTDRVLHEIRPGSVVLFHDGEFGVRQTEHRYGELTLESVAALLARLRGRLHFVTLPELLRSGTARRELWFRYP
jgi:peptidoglycan-N-acetylglucosamine deacetylase